MAANLKELADAVSSGDATSWRAQAEQHLLQTAALARLLSYLAFAFAEGGVIHCPSFARSSGGVIYAVQRGRWVEIVTRPQGWLFAGDTSIVAGSVYTLEHTVDVRSAVTAASSGLALLATLPWVATYLTFLPRHPAAAALPYFRWACRTSARLLHRHYSAASNACSL
jgi:hypothetical protein